MRAATIALAFSLAGCSGISGNGGTHGTAPPASLSGRGTGTMHVALTAPAATTFDVASATCLLSPRGAAGGGLHVSTSASGATQSASVDDARVGADGRDDWTATATASTLDAPLHVHVTLPDGVIFSGGPGSAATLTSSAAGTSGTVSFSGATYAGKSGVADAAGTITWSCTAS